MRESRELRMKRRTHQKKEKGNLADGSKNGIRGILEMN
jgi:hypothetical protein